MLFLTGFAVVVVIVVPLVVAKLIFSLSSERASYVYRIIFLLPIVVPGVAIQLIWGGMVYNDSGPDQHGPAHRSAWTDLDPRMVVRSCRRSSGRSRSSGFPSAAGSTS